MARCDADILVVGAGPAGAAAAREAARSGARTLVVERRGTVGVPVQCAEFIPAMLLGRIGLGKDFIAQRVEGMKTCCPGIPDTFTRAPGYIINRDRFDQALVRAAAAAGAEIMTATCATGWSDGGTVALRRKDGRCMEVCPRIVIGADGPRSSVGKWVGAVNDTLLPGLQQTYSLTGPLDHTEVHFHPDIRAGYGWLFPKGTVANVGIGLSHRRRSAIRVRKTLDDFVRRLKADDRIQGAPLGAAAGWIPAQAVRRAVFGRIALVGDAAGHTHPITGAGIFAAVVGGEMAGKWAGRAVREGNPGLLAHYDEEWRDLMGDTLQRAHRRRQEMEAHWEHFTETVQRCWVAFRAYYA